MKKRNFIKSLIGLAIAKPVLEGVDKPALTSDVRDISSSAATMQKLLTNPLYYKAQFEDTVAYFEFDGKNFAIPTRRQIIPNMPQSTLGYLPPRWNRVDGEWERVYPYISLRVGA